MLNDALKIIAILLLGITLIEAFGVIDAQIKFDRCMRVYTLAGRTVNDIQRYADTNCGKVLRKALND